MRTGFFLLVIVLIAIAALWLQVFLSKKESKWPGLVLPLICFAYSLIMLLSVAVFAGMSRADVIMLIVSTFVMANIPTLIFIAIYCACREKAKRSKALEKMSILDLE